MSIATSPALSSRVLGILRIVSAYLLLTHASAKFFAIPHVAYFDNLQLFSLIGLAGVLELVGGVLLLIGLFTRPVAFVLSGLLAFAYFIGHVPKGFFFAPMMNGGESAVLFCFVFLYFAVAGAGSFSIDNRRNAA
ncbi:MAG: DoxX family protein [Burkholderiaceae bacterium]|nr:DoxX family protein [Burkholderiaceae bacterium]